MIDLEQTTLVYLLLCSVALGALLGVLYDLIRFAKMMLGVEYGKTDTKQGRVRRAIVFAVTFVSDVIFWVIFAASSVILTYNVSGGVFRAMVYVSMIAGGAVYYFTIGRLTLKLGIKLSKLIKKVAAKLLRLVIVPFRAIISLIIKLYHLTIGKVIGKIISERNRRRKERQKAISAPAVLPQKIQEENQNNVRKNRYEREGRISFGMRVK